MKPIRSGEFYAVSAALLWGLNYVIVKMVLGEMAEGQFLPIRFLCTAAFLALYLRLRGEDFTVRKEHLLPVALLGVVGVGLYNIIWTYGIHLTTAANAALLISTSPIFTGIYTAALQKEPLPPLKWCGIILAFLGIFLLVRQTEGAAIRLDSGYFLGNLLVLAGALLFSLYGVIAKPLLHCYSPVKLTTLAMLGSLVILIPFGLIQCPVSQWSGIAPAMGAKLAYVVGCGTILAFTFWYEGIKYTGPLKTVLFHYLVPVTSILLSPLLLGENFNAGQIIGAALVLAGLLISNSDFPKCFHRNHLIS